jgi:flagellin
LQREVDALNDEFNRVVQSTTFNGRNLFEGTDTAVAIQAGFGTDGILTLALGSSLSRAQGDGMFTQIQTVGSWSGDAAAVSADLNGDGRDDLVTVGSGVVNVRLGMAYGTVSTTLLSSTGPAAGSAYNLDAIADFDGDGTLDLLAHDSLNAPSLECREIGMEASHLWLLRNSS